MNIQPYIYDLDYSYVRILNMKNSGVRVAIATATEYLSDTRLSYSPPAKVISQNSFLSSFQQSCDLTRDPQDE